MVTIKINKKIGVSWLFSHIWPYPKLSLFFESENFWVGRAHAPCFQIGMALLVLQLRDYREAEKARLGPYWYAIVANLLRMLLLYQHGGIYVDTDIIVVRLLNSL